MTIGDVVTWEYCTRGTQRTRTGEIVEVVLEGVPATVLVKCLGKAYTPMNVRLYDKDGVPKSKKGTTYLVASGTICNQRMLFWPKAGKLKLVEESYGSSNGQNTGTEK